MKEQDTRKPAGLTLAPDPLWYKDAIIYQLHVKAFGDANGDGMGDFRGIIERLDYVQDLGVNTLWLLPFYPSPQRDDGYDIADYRNVHPNYGTRRDIKAFIREAHRRGLRVVTELVINHTSDQHPWFQAARRAPRGSAKRDFYVWSDDDKRFADTRIIFTDTEISNWAWDPVAEQYYWHRFFSHQPDLNHNNPEVVKAVIRVMRFWLDMGVDGLRLDAIPYLTVREGTTNENLPETHEVLKQMRDVVDEHYDDRMFLAEANQWPEDVRDYFGDGDECHVAYHFPLMPRMYMAIAQEDRHPIVEIMAQTPDIPDACQWAIFLRNHDELTLEMVTDRERDYMYRTYAADPRMRVNVGIRRRLAPLMDNDGDKIRLMNSLLMSMPGSPIIYYGDEIGMGDNIYLGDRNGVRTPMQWSPDRNAGFSRADPQRLYLPPIMDPVYGYEAVNVEAQLRAPSSLLNWMKRLIAVRKDYKAFGRGRLEFIHPGNRKVLAFTREHEGEVILCVANLARSPQPVELDLSRFKGAVPVELMGRTAFPPIGELPYLLTLAGHGFYWFSLSETEAEPGWHEERLPPAELPMLVLFDGWRSFAPERVQSSRRTMSEQLVAQLERVLPRFLNSQRWFAAKSEGAGVARLSGCREWRHGGDSWLLTEVEATQAGDHYFLPLAIRNESEGEERLRALGPAIVARVRRQSSTGMLFDAFADEGFVRAMLAAMRGNQRVAVDGGELHFSSTRALQALTGDELDSLAVQGPQGESSNTTLAIGERLFLKGYRRLQRGINPELEMGVFLTEHSPYANISPLAGALEFVADDGTRTALAVLQGYQSNQGDAWNWTQGYLQRYLRDWLLHGADQPEDEQPHLAWLIGAETLGRRTAELHRALAVSTGDPAFDPEPITDEDVSRWHAAVREELNETLRQLQTALPALAPADGALAERLLAASDELRGLLSGGEQPDTVQALKTRYHGDYHLGQVLVAEDDFVIIDFEGEPARALAERRAKHCALRDVAGMVRSFDYAARSALATVTERRPEETALLAPAVAAWRDQAESCFLAGYAEAIEGCDACPAEPRERDALLQLFTLEKALYELRYELGNRPAWVGVPLGGLLALLRESA